MYTAENSKIEKYKKKIKIHHSPIVERKPLSAFGLQDHLRDIVGGVPDHPINTDCTKMNPMNFSDSQCT